MTRGATARCAAACFAALAALAAGCSSSSTTPASTALGPSSGPVPTIGPTITSTIASTSPATVPSPSTTSTTTSTITTPTTVPSTTSAPLDCGVVTSGRHTLEVTAAAQQPSRAYIVWSPDRLGLAGGLTRAPVVVLFHGFGSNGADEAERTGFAALGPAHGVIVVAPDAAGSPSEWHITDASYADAAYTDDLLAALRDSPCVDTSAIWLAGFSAGSAWTGVYGCGHAAGLAGLLMHSGLPPAICPDRTPLDVMIVHGTADPVVPFTGGDQPVGGTTVHLASVAESAAAWAARAGCGSSPTVAALGTGSILTTWTGCAGGHTVSLQAVGGLGHAWAGGTQAPGPLNPACLLVARLAAIADPVTACTPSA